MTRIGLLFLVSLSATLPAVSAERPGPDALTRLERKLHGSWRGGPCVGSLLFTAAGTYERKHHSPANVRSAGTWSLQWDALPPTLNLTCQSSDDPEDIKRTIQYKLSRLDDAEFAITRETGAKALVYARNGKPKQTPARSTATQSSPLLTQ